MRRAGSEADADALCIAVSLLPLQLIVEPTAFGAVARVRLRATGEFGAYCLPRPQRVKLDGKLVDFGYDELTGLLRVSMDRQATDAELTVEFPRRLREQRS